MKRSQLALQSLKLAFRRSAGDQSKPILTSLAVQRPELGCLNLEGYLPVSHSLDHVVHHCHQSRVRQLHYQHNRVIAQIRTVEFCGNIARRMRRVILKCQIDHAGRWRPSIKPWVFQACRVWPKPRMAEASQIWWIIVSIRAATFPKYLLNPSVGRSDLRVLHPDSLSSEVARFELHIML